MYVYVCVHVCMCACVYVCATLMCSTAIENMKLQCFTYTIYFVSFDIDD